MNPLSLAIELTQEAGELLQGYALPLDIREKSARGDLVTSADRASEALIAARLQSAFPASSLLGEEGGVRRGTSDERWIFDPLDGTTNFAHGYPLYCVSIAYERAGEIVCAATYAPALGELYAAERGAGATCNGIPLRVSGILRVAEAMVCTGFQPARYDRNGPSFAALSRRAQAVRRDGSAALDLAFVARGRFDAFWEFDLSPWDMAAGALLVSEAGGRVEATDGSPFALGGSSILASNGAVHDEMRRTLAATG